MPKNRFGGNKAKKNRNNVVAENTNTPLATDKSMYAQVKRVLGGNKIELLCSDTVIRTGTIPGSMMKKVWIYIDDIVLVELRECDTDKKICDIIYKYNKIETRRLQSLGVIGFANKYGKMDDKVIPIDENEDIDFI